LNPDSAFAASERQALLDTCFPAIQRRSRVVELRESADAKTREDLRPEFERLNETIRTAWNTYQQGLPVLALSRCPFTGKVWSHSLDIYGIDGFWWNCYQPIRRLDEPLGGQFYAFRGAVASAPQVPTAPFLVEPGPELPFVIGRLMAFPSVVAVISHVRVGELDAYPVVYFASEELSPEERTNDWATDSFSFRGPQGHFEQRQYFDAEDEFLYDLAPWVEQQRVRWIAPGDESLTIRTGTIGCPYLQLPGRPCVWRSKAGKIWWGPPGKVRAAGSTP
ncbi:MAG: hypothetical protein AB7O38_31770, partial [Pirellulaceae bacterium]